MVERVILVKSLKQLFKRALQGTSLHLQRQTIKQLLNLLFQEGDTDSNKMQVEDDQDGPNSKKNKKKKGK
jgi:hypothetical protein